MAENNIDSPEELKPKRKKWIKWLTNPFIVIVPSVIFLLFYSENSYLNKTKNQDRIDELKAEIQQNIDSTAFYERKAAALDTDKERLEKIAREQYGMKRDNEEVYITDIK